MFVNKPLEAILKQAKAKAIEEKEPYSVYRTTTGYGIASYADAVQNRFYILDTFSGMS